jgi:type I restriction enzyme S subunit
LAVIDCKNRTPPVTDDGHPVIRTPNVRNGEFAWSDLAHTDPASYVIWTARGRPQSGDIVITREAPVGEVCMIPDDVVAPCLGQRMMLYRPDPERVNGHYMLHAIQSQRVQKHLDVISGGSTVGHVKVGDIRNLRLPLPLVDEQLLIVKSVEAARAELRTLREDLAKLRQQKQGLMQDLLTGRVPVNA